MQGAEVRKLLDVHAELVEHTLHRFLYGLAGKRNKRNLLGADTIIEGLVYPLDQSVSFTATRWAEDQLLIRHFYLVGV